MEHRRLVQKDVAREKPPHVRDVIEVQHLGPLVEQHALRKPGRAARVHEDDWIVFFRLIRHLADGRGKQLFVTMVVGSVTVADHHDVIDADVAAHLIDDTCEERVGETDVRS